MMRQSRALKADPAVLERYLGVAGAAAQDLMGVETMQRTKALFRADEVGSPVAATAHQGSARQAGEGRDHGGGPAQGRRPSRSKRSCTSRPRSA